MVGIGTPGGLQVDLMALGARITALWVPLPDGSRRNVVLGLGTREEYLASDGYLGATIGRVANRIRGGALELDGVRHELPVNDRGNTLHGGADGFDRRDWTLVDAGPRHAVFELVSPDGDQGFPGTLTVRAAYEVAGAELRTTYAATTDAPTVVSLTSHPYFDLEGPAGDVAAHTLRVAAREYLPVDGTGIPLGDPVPVAGTRFDLTAPTRLGPDLDHCWILDRTGDRTGDGSAVGLRPAAVLEGGGLRLELATDQPALQVYTGAGRWNGIALEPQHAPDSPHHPQWPSTVLRPGEEYRWRSVVRIVPAPVDQPAGRPVDRPVTSP